MQKLAGTDQDKVKFGKSDLDFDPTIVANKIEPHSSETGIFKLIIGNACNASTLAFLDQQRPLPEDSDCKSVTD